MASLTILLVICAFQVGFSLVRQRCIHVNRRANIANRISFYHLVCRITAAESINSASVDTSMKRSGISSTEVLIEQGSSQDVTVDLSSVYVTPSITYLPVDKLPNPTESLKSKSITSRIKFPSWHSPRGENNELIRELVAGSVAALVTIPTSIAYATIIGLSPLIGVWTSVIVGLGVCLVGGAPGLIAGAAGVVAVPLAKLVSLHGSQTMGITVLISGLMEVLFGAARLGKFADIVTEPVVVGFLNAFAIFLVKSQVRRIY